MSGRKDSYFKFSIPPFFLLLIFSVSLCSNLLFYTQPHLLRVSVLKFLIYPLYLLIFSVSLCLKNCWTAIL
jgi:hypothetical protein